MGSIGLGASNELLLLSNDIGSADLGRLKRVYLLDPFRCARPEGSRFLSLRYCFLETAIVMMMITIMLMVDLICLPGVQSTRAG